MLEELRLKKLQERTSIAKLKMLHSFCDGYKFVTGSLLPSKARDTNLHFKPKLGCMKVYDGSSQPYTVSLWNKLLPHIVNTAITEHFSDHVSDIDLEHFA